jgi:hypothetical protein
MKGWHVFTQLCSLEQSLLARARQVHTYIREFLNPFPYREDIRPGERLCSSAWPRNRPDAEFRPLRVGEGASRLSIFGHPDCAFFVTSQHVEQECSEIIALERQLEKEG